MRQRFLAVALFLFGLHSQAQTWALLSPTGTTPPGRGYYSSVYNASHNRLVVFGGWLNYQSVPTLGNDVWVLTNADGTTGVTGWQQLSPVGTLPAARGNATAVYDTANNRMIIFGGNPSVGYCNVDLNDVWVLTNADGTTGSVGWIQLSPTSGPPSGRTHNAMVYDPLNNRAIIYGGNQECSSVDSDVWVLSNANGLGGTPVWTQLSPTGTAPAPRSDGFAGYDPVNNLMIIFGGGTANGLTNDVWVLSHANGLGGTPTWTQVAVANSAPPRNLGFGSYDSGTDSLLVFGGDAPGETNDVWQLSFANNIGGAPSWSKLSPGGTAPSPREGVGGLFNASSHRVIIYGGLTCNSSCATDSDVWSLAFSPPPAIFSFAPTNGFPGTAVTINGTNFGGATAVYFNGTSAAFTVNSGTQITATVPTNATTGFISVVTTNGTASSTYNFSVINLPPASGTWTHLSPTGTTPPGRDYFSSVFSQTSDRMIVFGGQLNYQSVPSLGNDVWVLTNADGVAGSPGWTQLSPGGTLPGARSMNSAVYDSANNRMIIFGGNPNVGNCNVDLNDVWVLTNADGTASASGWVQLSPTGTVPAARAHHAAVYDSVNNRMIIFGGNNECQSSTNDVWVLSNANGLGGTPAWTQLSPTGGPPAARSSFFAGYDQTNNLLIIFGGGTAGGLTNDVWVLSHANGLGGTPAWSLLNAFGNTPPRDSGGGVYDPAGNTLTVFAGLVSGQTNDVWRLYNANNLGGTPVWVQVNTAGTTPAAREGPGLVYNPSSYRLTAYGGLNCAPGCAPLSDVWTLNLAPQPAIFSFTPTNGSVGATVIITGTNFGGATAVYFNGTNAAFTVNSGSQITVTVPTNATVGPITVVTSNGMAVSANNFVVGSLAVTSGFTPASGAFGTMVTISGTNFATASSVIFNGAPAVFTVNSDLQITATVPSCAGTGPIAITDSAGTSVTASNFTFIKQPVTVYSPTEAALDDALCNGTTITFAFDGVITITNTKNISSDIVLDGTGHNVAILGGYNARMFSVGVAVHFTLRNLTIGNGYASGFGGAISSSGIVIVDNCTFSNNVVVGVTGGNGLSNVGDGLGGAIYNYFFGTLIVNDSTFVGNAAYGGAGSQGTNGASEYAQGGPGGNGYIACGGAIFNDGGSVSITNCTFYNNQAVGGNGGFGGMGANGYTYEYCCAHDIFGDCTEYCTGYYYGGPGGNGGNAANGYGGNAYNNSGSFVMVNTTLAGGTVKGGFGGSGGSPGAYSSGGAGTIGANGFGYGGNLGGGPGIVLKNCIVANPGAGLNYSGSAIKDAGNNLSSDASLLLTNSTSFTNANPNLGSLTNHGGPTWTMALLPASPAIRAGDTNGAPAFDQRGQPRKAILIDLGAFETPVLTSSLPSLVFGKMNFATGPFRLTFTNSPGTSFSVWSSTNLLTPFGGWTWIGYAREVSPGQFLFNDLGASNSADEFYRVISP